MYGNTLVAVAALNLARVEAATAAPYRAALRTLQARAPDARARFDVYRDAYAVRWVQDPCRPEDAEPGFFLRVVPADPQALPPHRRQAGFAVLNFSFPERGVRLDDACLVSVPLPAYPLRALRVGQRGAQPWQADLPLVPRPEYRAVYRRLTARPPTHRGPFDVYVTAATATFAKAPCTAADLAPKFILHAAPADPQALPGRAFANLDFPFPARGAQFADACLASVPLPAYPLRRLTVGQWISGAPQTRWQADLALPPAPRAVQAYRRAWRALAPALPAHRDVFDVYVTATAVAYAKTPCTAADTEPAFLLHVVPVRARDLPPARRAAGFDNRDFRFAGQGAHFDGRCLARAPLPAYPIASLRVGQFRTGAEAPLWVAEIPPAR